MSKTEFPKWIYKSGAAKIVNSEKELKEAGDGWKDSPAEFVKKEKKPLVKDK